MFPWPQVLLFIRTLSLVILVSGTLRLSKQLKTYRFTSTNGSGHENTMQDNRVVG